MWLFTCIFLNSSQYKFWTWFVPMLNSLLNFMKNLWFWFFLKLEWFWFHKKWNPKSSFSLVLQKMMIQVLVLVLISILILEIKIIFYSKWLGLKLMVHVCFINWSSLIMHNKMEPKLLIKGIGIFPMEIHVLIVLMDEFHSWKSTFHSFIT
jgi:hypothetical protein